MVVDADSLMAVGEQHSQEMCLIGICSMRRRFRDGSLTSCSSKLRLPIASDNFGFCVSYLPSFVGIFSNPGMQFRFWNSTANRDTRSMISGNCLLVQNYNYSTTYPCLLEEKERKARLALSAFHCSEKDALLRALRFRPAQV